MVVLALGAGWASGQTAGPVPQHAPPPTLVPTSVPTPAPTPTKADKNASEPFYRRYLVPGDKLDDKIVDQEHRVEASPEDANLRNDFGNLLAQRRFPAQAAEQYEIAMKLDPKNFIAAYNLGLLRETEGKLSAAASAYQKSIKRKPGFPQSRFRLGRVYEHMNQPQAAVEQYAAAMWIDPAIRDAKRNPLVIDSELMYLASLTNYQRDMAVASMTDAHVYFDTDRFRKLPVDRAITSKEVEKDEKDEESEAAAPRDVGLPTGAGTATSTDPARKTPRAGSTESFPGAPARGNAIHPTPVPRPRMQRPSQPPAPAPEGEPTPPGTETPPENAPEPTPAPGEVEPS